MATDKVLYKEESQQIIGCAIRVHNELGYGFHEKPYENALTIEFQNNQIPFEQQKPFPLIYQSQPVGEFIPDLIVFDKIIIDTKTIEQITDREMGQMINYLKVTNMKLGYLINFKHHKLEWKRVVL